MDNAVQLYQKANGLLDEGRYIEAIQLAEQISIEPLKAAILIDAGVAISRPNPIKEGISLIEKALQSSEQSFTKSSLLYNMANGYSSLYKLKAQKGGKIVPPNDDYLRRAKSLYQQVVKDLSLEEDSFRSQLWTNYANCLSASGRSVESIAAFNMAAKHDSNNGIALGNLGIELEHFSRISSHYRHDYILYAHQLLTKALSKNAHLQYGDPKIEIWYEDNLTYLQAIIDAHQGSIHTSGATEVVEKTGSEYTKFCYTNRLFLNAWVGEIRYAPAISDDIHYGPIVTAIHDTTTVPSLLKILNEIKESFATARYLFFLSQSSDPALQKISELSFYDHYIADDLYGIPIGLLKTAYVRAFDILDKVARIINIYFNIGNERQGFWATFATKESRGEAHELRYVMRPEFTGFNNFGLYALADICIEYHESEYVDFKEIDAQRNLITHDYLTVIFDETLMSPGPKEITQKKLRERTLNLLQFVRSVILYAVIAVNLDSKDKKDSGHTPNIYYDTLPGYTP